jgi:hypothetical protein
MTLLFRPIGIIGGLIAGLLGKKLFEAIWSRIDDEEPPEAKHQEISLPKLVFALLLEGALFRLVRGLFDHESRSAFARVTGRWPGETAPDPR